MPDLFVWMGDRSARKQWLTLPPRALSFIKKLLIVEPEKRMTASDTLDHEWYKLPLTEAIELERGCERVIGSWNERDIGINIMEDLPGQVSGVPTLSNLPLSKLYVSKIRREKLPDTSMSPYFNLDRHIMKETPSKRTDLLENLSQSGSRFITETYQNGRPAATTIAQRDSTVAITSVDGNDIFGKFLQSDLDEVNLVNIAPLASSQRAYGSPLRSPACLQGNTQMSDIDTLSRKRARKRKESLDQEDRRNQDIVATRMSRYTTAKAMKDAVIR